MCKRFINDTITIQRFMNPEGHHHPVPAGSEQGGIFTPWPATFVDGIVTCRFMLSGFTQARKQPNKLKHFHSQQIIILYSQLECSMLRESHFGENVSRNSNSPCF